jgi:hypothetical protein
VLGSLASLLPVSVHQPIRNRAQVYLDSSLQLPQALGLQRRPLEEGSLAIQANRILPRIRGQVCSEEPKTLLVNKISNSRILQEDCLVHKPNSLHQQVAYLELLHQQLLLEEAYLDSKIPNSNSNHQEDCSDSPLKVQLVEAYSELHNSKPQQVEDSLGNLVRLLNLLVVYLEQNLQELLQQEVYLVQVHQLEVHFSVAQLRNQPQPVLACLDRNLNKHRAASSEHRLLHQIY